MAFFEKSVIDGLRCLHYSF